MDDLLQTIVRPAMEKRRHPFHWDFGFLLVLMIVLPDFSYNQPLYWAGRLSPPISPHRRSLSWVSRSP